MKVEYIKRSDVQARIDATTRRFSTSTSAPQAGTSALVLAAESC
jgi:hypothetical protein